MNRETLLTILFRHRGGLLLLLAAPVVFAALRGRAMTWTSALLGIGLVAAGVLLRLSAVRRIGRGARVHRAHASAGMIASGPYRWTRNPLYLSAALMIGGFSALAGAGWTAAALTLATLLVYTPVVLAEERALVSLFGATYEGYLASVPRWIGIPRSFGREPARPLVSWREVFHREKWLVPGATAAACAIAALNSNPYAAEHIEFAFGLDLALVVSVAAIVVFAAHTVTVEARVRSRQGRRSLPTA
jgi:protein-S-isoprenylcysteine O-methyltransferase Ste14